MAKKREKRECKAVVLEHDAAGIDIGAEEIYVAVPPDRDEESVRMFSSFTCDLMALADWLQRCRIRTVAMESTGVYWIPLMQILEARAGSCESRSSTLPETVPATSVVASADASSEHNGMALKKLGQCQV